MVRRATAYVTPQDVEDRARGWAATVRGKVRPRPHLQLQPERAALVVVDMINAFCAPDGSAFLPAAPAVLRQLARLLPVWRRAGGAVVFTRHGHDGPHDTGMLGDFFTDYIRWESAESELVAGMAPEADDLVLRKRTYDAFHDTPLEPWLRSHGRPQVLVAGVLTHMCCATTTRTAFVRGLATHLLVDGTASSSLELHLAALHTLADSVAILHTTSEVLQRCG